MTTRFASCHLPDRRRDGDADCLERSTDACLTFFNFPPEEWISLRTTNIIERLNKEFRRRTKVMEIVSGEIAGYWIPAYISWKKEMHWRSNPVGKVRKDLPFYKELAHEYFTQKIDSTELPQEILA